MTDNDAIIITFLNHLVKELESIEIETDTDCETVKEAFYNYVTKHIKTPNYDLQPNLMRLIKTNIIDNIHIDMSIKIFIMNCFKYTQNIVDANADASMDIQGRGGGIKSKKNDTIKNPNQKKTTL